MRPKARHDALEEYERLAAERTLEHAIRGASFIGVVRTESVREVSISESIIEARVVSTWAGSTQSQDLHLRINGRDYCDPSTYRARSGKEALVFLFTEAPDVYRVAGRGWGYLLIEESNGESVAVGTYPAPRNIRSSISEDEYRMRTWSVSLGQLSEEVQRTR
jgi:hypothetical protein